jgi:DNA helicase IV
MPHSFVEEQKFHRQLRTRVASLLSEVVEKLRGFQYQYEGQRKNDGNIKRDLEFADRDSYFGVIFLKDLVEDQYQQYRIGRRAVLGDVQDDGIHNGIVSWQSPFAAIYNREDSTINSDLGFGETMYRAQVVIEHGEVVELVESRTARDARVRSEIQKPKTENLGDILETIRPDQDYLVRIRETLPVVIQGGPGTGKTVVGLQRLAYATTNADGIFKDEDVLAIGPTRSYVNYVKNYLPGLGITSFKNQTINDLVLEALTVEDQEKVKVLREETEEIVREKNSPKLDEIIRKTIWGEVVGIQIEFKRMLSNNINPSAVVPASDVEKILEPIYEQFQAGTIDYENARVAFARELQTLMVNGRSSAVFAIGNRTNEQRIEALLESWLLQVGVRSQERREYWKKILERNTGNRIRREMAAILRTFYIKDIREAIDLLVDEQTDNELTLEPIVLKRKLEELGTLLKGDNEETEIETESGVRSIKVSDLRDADPVDERGIRPQVQGVVDQILAKKTSLEVASFVVTGTSPAFDAKNEAVRSLGRKLNRSAAFKDGTGDQYFWTDADIPVVGVIANSLRKTVSRFEHILVDEAQDLTRMQSKIVSHYLKNSSLTLLGDINQATKPAALGNWQGLMQSLGFNQFILKTLEQNYRVPSNIFDYAISFLPAPYDLTSVPSPELEGGDIKTPIDITSETLRQDILNIINSKDSSERIAVISEDLDVVDSHQFAAEQIKVVTPEECKGLEFDHSIVVTPADWYDGSTAMARRMYVVLTRATKSVTILQPNIENTLIKVHRNEIID